MMCSWVFFLIYLYCFESSKLLTKKCMTFNNLRCGTNKLLLYAKWKEKMFLVSLHLSLRKTFLLWPFHVHYTPIFLNNGKYSVGLAYTFLACISETHYDKHTQQKKIYILSINYIIRTTIIGTCTVCTNKKIKTCKMKIF